MVTLFTTTKGETSTKRTHYRSRFGSIALAVLVLAACGGMTAHAAPLPVGSIIELSEENPLTDNCSIYYTLSQPAEFSVPLPSGSLATGKIDSQVVQHENGHLGWYFGLINTSNAGVDIQYPDIVQEWNGYGRDVGMDVGYLAGEEDTRYPTYAYRPADDPGTVSFMGDSPIPSCEISRVFFVETDVSFMDNLELTITPYGWEDGTYVTGEPVTAHYVLVPEPAGLALVGIGAVLLAFYGRWRQKRRSFKGLPAVLVAMMLALPAVARADQLGIYEFTGTSTGDYQFNMVTSPAPGVEFGGFYRDGVQWAEGNNVFNSQGWSTTDEAITGLVGFLFHVDETHSATITGLSFDQRGSSTVANHYLVAYGGYLDTILGVLVKDDVETSITHVSLTFDYPLVVEPDGIKKFLWGVYGTVQADGEGEPLPSGTFRLDNVALHGQLSPIPEPASLALALCGAAALAAVSWARRRARRR